MTAPKLGYLLPTRERIMSGRNENGPMLHTSGDPPFWLGADASTG